MGRQRERCQILWAACDCIGAQRDLAEGDLARTQLAGLSSEVEKALARPDRCRVEELGDGRYLFHNVRRQPGGAPQRLLL
jgi:hypothetical protein